MKWILIGLGWCVLSAAVALGIGRWFKLGEDVDDEQEIDPYDFSQPPKE